MNLHFHNIRCVCVSGKVCIVHVTELNCDIIKTKGKKNMKSNKEQKTQVFCLPFEYLNRGLSKFHYFLESFSPSIFLKQIKIL